MPKLYLIPTTLSNTIQSSALLCFEHDKIKHICDFIVETPKTARMHLKALGLNYPLQQLNLQELNKHSKDIQKLIQPLLSGRDMGLISDCGLPSIADPGSLVVAEAHKNGIEVVPLVGPSSLMLGLMASGVNGQCFSFNGYLPIEINQRKQKIWELQREVLTQNRSQIIIETPFRNQQLLALLVDILEHSITLCIAINLMQNNQQIISLPVGVWRTKFNQDELPVIAKQEVVFIIGMSF